MLFRKFDHLTIYSLALTLVSFVMVYFSFDGRNNSVVREREIAAQQTEAKELGYILKVTSDYLTSEVRNFVVSLNPIHLQNYWDEIKVTKRREYVLDRMKVLKAPYEEFALLDEAKLQSDELVFTETRAMRLIMEVYDVEESLMEPELRDFQLTQEDENLSNVEKVNKARQILFTREYDLDKEKIMLPIRQFQQAMETRIASESEDAKSSSDYYYMLSTSWQVVLTIMLFMLVFNVIKRLGTPLKDLEHQLDQNPEKVEISTQAMSIILNITANINKILSAKGEATKQEGAETNT